MVEWLAGWFPSDQEDQVVWFTALTATFTGLGLLVSVFAYRHTKVDSGAKRPLMVKREGDFPNLDPNFADHLDDRRDSRKLLWEFALHVHNRSSVPQRMHVVSFDVLWPRDTEARGFRKWYWGETYDFEPHAGGNVRFLLANDAFMNASFEEVEDLVSDYKRSTRSIWVRIRMATGSGYRSTYWGRIEVSLWAWPTERAAYERRFRSLFRNESPVAEESGEG